MPTAAPKYVFSERDDADGEPLHRFDVHADRRNVGYLTAHPATEGGIWLEGMRVARAHRRQGLADALLRLAIEKYRDQDMRLRAKPYGDKPLSAAQLQSFYARHGFAPVDEEGRMLRKAATFSASIGKLAAAYHACCHG